MRYEIFDKLENVPIHWDHITRNKKVTLTREFLTFLEQSKLNDFNYYYILIFDENDSAVGATVCYTVTTDFLAISSKILKYILEKIRKVFPWFFQMQILEYGSPVTIMSPPFICTSANMPDFLKTLNNALLHIAKANKKFLLLIRDFELDSNSEKYKNAFEKIGKQLAII